jgi:hypothetical protein
MSIDLPYRLLNVADRCAVLGRYRTRAEAIQAGKDRGHLYVAAYGFAVIISEPDRKEPKT